MPLLVIKPQNDIRCAQNDKRCAQNDKASALPRNLPVQAPLPPLREAHFSHLRLRPLGADQSAVGVINRSLRLLAYTPISYKNRLLRWQFSDVRLSWWEAKTGFAGGKALLHGGLCQDIGNGIWLWCKCTHFLL